jgi:hypothetical protein
VDILTHKAEFETKLQHYNVEKGPQFLEKRAETGLFIGIRKEGNKECKRNIKNSQVGL